MWRRWALEPLEALERLEALEALEALELLEPMGGVEAGGAGQAEGVQHWRCYAALLHQAEPRVVLRDLPHSMLTCSIISFIPYHARLHFMMLRCLIFATSCCAAEPPLPRVMLLDVLYIRACYLIWSS